MIKGNIRSEKQYRALPIDSSSSLKEFSMDRKKYYKKYLLNEVVEEEEDSKATIMGKLTETLLFEEDKFDEKFYLSSIASVPTGNMLNFVEALYKHTKAATNEDGEVTLPFVELAELAYKDSGYKRDKIETVLSKFIGKDPELYYQEIRSVRSRGLTVVTLDEVTNAKRVVEGLKNSPYTGPILNLIDSDRYTILVQKQIDDYDINGLPMKSMIDLIIIDNQFKIIYIYDLKTVWSVEGFFRDYYLYRRAYIQAYVYFKAAEALKQQLGLEDYIVRYPQFIVCDSISYYQPLIYQLDSDDIQDAWKGFVFENKYYPGVETIVEDLKWAHANDIWNISRQNYLNNGVVKIKNDICRI